MKKSSIFRLLVITALGLILGSALLLSIITLITLPNNHFFNDTSTQTYPVTEPYQTTVFLRTKDGTPLTPEQFATWQAEIQTLITNTADDTTNPKITAVDYAPTSNINIDEPFPVNFTLANVPAATAEKIIRPFKIHYQETLFNPIALLPTSETLEYVIGYTFERRHSQTNADEVVVDQTNGNYIYLWSSTDPVQIKNIYPNRPLYYLIIFWGILLLSVVVYFVSRYNDCKKQKLPL